MHGDFHPGNVRGTPGRFVILDWGDSGVGHPMIDQLAFVPAARHGPTGSPWNASGRRSGSGVVPGCDADPGRRPAPPVAALNAAVVYQHFLDNIEPAERRYHAGDPLGALRDAIARLNQLHRDRQPHLEPAARRRGC